MPRQSYFVIPEHALVETEFLIRVRVFSSGAYLLKYERPDIALFYATAPLANDVRLAPGQLVTPDFAAHARRLLAALGQLHKIYDGEPFALSKEPAAEDGLRAHDRP